MDGEGSNHGTKRVQRMGGGPLLLRVCTSGCCFTTDPFSRSCTGNADIQLAQGAGKDHHAITCCRPLLARSMCRTCQLRTM
jgi:hypothetical protein